MLQCSLSRRLRGPVLLLLAEYGLLQLVTVGRRCREPPGTRGRVSYTFKHVVLF